MQTFDFYRFRFVFRALEPVQFPPGQSGNIVRGALGKILREMASPEVYTFLFEAGAGKGGQADRPRPFVLRCAHLDGLAPERGEGFFLDVHVFELQRPLLECFRGALERLAEEGIGPGRGRVELTAVQALDVAGNPMAVTAPVSVPLDGDAGPVPMVSLRFLTPTELKSGGRVAERPEFCVLFARLYERVNALRVLYGAESNRTQAGMPVLHDVRMTRCDITWEYGSRKSTRTGQTHPLGGFSGEADYEGELAGFLPWLHAMRWAGVGRQTVWGKGDVRVVEAGAETPLLTRATPW